MDKKEEVLVSYSTKENQRKLEEYISSKTGKQIDLGPLSYGGKGSIWVIDTDMRIVTGLNVTGAMYFPGKRFKSIEKFIEWHKNLDLQKEKPEEPRNTADMLNQMIDEECRRRGMEPIKNGNKTGTKVIVRTSFPEEKPAVFSDRENNR